MKDRMTLASVVALAAALTLSSSALAQRPQRGQHPSHVHVAKSPDNAKSLKAHVAGEMRKFGTAFRHKDGKAAEAVIRANFDPSFQEVDQRGKSIDLDAFIASELNRMNAMHSVRRMDLKIRSVKIDGSTATSQESLLLEGTVPDAKAKGKFSHLKVDAQWTSTMQKEGDKWMVVRQATKSEHTFINGKPVPMEG